MRPTKDRTGLDGLKSLTVRAKIQTLLPQYSMSGGYVYQADFADLVSQAEGVEGIPYAFPPWDAPDELLAQAFEEWLALPDGNVQDMRAALKDETPPLASSSKKKSDKS